ncbi:rod shape-determining protein MreC [Patescibacteria group bacterium]|nr:rod shape-determining protein MreC [Patescibacteria group bacterium]
MTKIIPDFKVLILLIFLSLMLLLLDTFHLLNFPKQAVFYITNPVSFGIYNTGNTIGRQFYFIFAARFAAQENIALKEQMGRLISENADLRKKLAEAEALVSQSQHLDPQKYNLLSARPIGLGRYLKIDKGASSGVRIGQAVVYEDNFIGKIVSVSEGGASVQLLTDPDSKITAFSQNIDGRAKGVLVGQFGMEARLDKILHEEKIGTGDLVYSEGLEEFLPRGLILGQVTQVLDQPNEVFKQAKIAPVFDIRDLELVFVIQE